MNRFKNTNGLVLCAFLLFSIVGTIIGGVDVYAGQGGEGGETGGGDGCYMGWRFNSKVCDDNPEEGGASWHMLKTTSSKNNTLHLYTGTWQPHYNESYSIMAGGGYDKKLTDTCPTSYDYYFVFVYDGWNTPNRDPGDPRTNPTNWGPVNVDVHITTEGGTDHYPEYNTTNYHSKEQIEAGFRNGTNMHNWRVGRAKKSGVALAMYNNYLESKHKSTVTTIPDNVGYFCFAPEQFTLKTYAKSGDSYLNGGNAFCSKTVGAGGTASCTAPAYTGYTWNKWGTQGDCKHAGTNTTCSISDMRADHTANAYYTRNSFQGRAYVSGGGASADTGYVTEDSTKSTEADCGDDGCTVTYQGYAKTITGSGKTNFDGTMTLLQSSPYAPSTSGTKLAETKNVSVAPGVTTCKYFRFRPFGSYGDDVIKKEEVCFKAKETTFEGNIDVSGATSGSTGWSNDSTKKTFFINKEDCNAVTGCKVSFKHQMKRNGKGTSTWAVSRDSNLTDTASGRSISSGSLDSGTLNADGVQTLKEDKDLTLYPGMVVCEKLTFKKSNISGAASVTVEACASALGKSQPDTPYDPDQPEDPNGNPVDMNGDGALVNIKVRNTNDKANGDYKKFRREIYAKPTDVLAYRATYNPNLQYTYYLKPQKLKVNGGSVYNNASTPSTLGTFYNAKKGSSLKNWNNAFSFDRASGPATNNFSSGGQDNLNKTFTKGLSKLTTADDLAKLNVADYTVQTGDAGKSVDKRIRTNANDNTKTTPKQVEFTKGDNDSNVANVDTGEMSKIAYARIPYNFTTNVKINNPEEDNDIGAGEEGVINFNVDLIPRKNTVTTNGSDDEKYVTKADDVIRKLVVFIPEGSTPRVGGQPEMSRDADLCSGYYRLSGGDKCKYSEPNNKTISIPANNGLRTKAEHSETISFVAPDLEAGEEICAAVAVYPASSGAPTNWNDKNYDGRWAISDAKCFTAVKKPTLQAWGGNVYAKGGIWTAETHKDHLEKKNTWDAEEGNVEGEQYVFGSWGETGVISGGPVIGFASGGASGYGKNDGGIGGLMPTVTFSGGDGIPGHYLGEGNNASFPEFPGGFSGTSTSFCLRSRLTIPNKKCGSNAGSVSDFSSLFNNSNNSIAAQSDKDKESILSKLIQRTDGDETALTGSDVAEGALERTDYYKAKNMTVNEVNMQGQAVIKVIHGENVRINGNIRYGNDDQTYDDLQKIPKVIIYAQRNININCDVYRIDAVLIAEDKVITCNSTDLDDLDDYQIENDIGRARNSNQLIVNGAIIAGTLKANRTYGAASGANSIIPAEIINFDPVLYNWGSSNTGDKDDNGFGSMEMNYLRELSPRK